MCLALVIHLMPLAAVNHPICQQVTYLMGSDAPATLPKSSPEQWQPGLKDLTLWEHRCSILFSNKHLLLRYPSLTYTLNLSYIYDRKFQISQNACVYIYICIYIHIHYTYIQYIKYTDIWFYERPPGESSIRPMESQRIGNTTPSVAGPRAQSPSTLQRNEEWHSVWWCLRV